MSRIARLSWPAIATVAATSSVTAAERLSPPHPGQASPTVTSSRFVLQSGQKITSDSVPAHAALVSPLISYRTCHLPVPGRRPRCGLSVPAGRVRPPLCTPSAACPRLRSWGA